MKSRDHWPPSLLDPDLETQFVLRMCERLYPLVVTISGRPIGIRQRHRHVVRGCKTKESKFKILVGTCNCSRLSKVPIVQNKKEDLNEKNLND